MSKSLQNEIIWNHGVKCFLCSCPELLVMNMLPDPWVERDSYSTDNFKYVGISTPAII